jgi:hypothetical protein
MHAGIFYNFELPHAHTPLLIAALIMLWQLKSLFVTNERLYCFWHVKRHIPVSQL